MLKHLVAQPNAMRGHDSILIFVAVDIAMAASWETIAEQCEEVARGTSDFAKKVAALDEVLPALQDLTNAFGTMEEMLRINRECLPAAQRFGADSLASSHGKQVRKAKTSSGEAAALPPAGTAASSASSVSFSETAADGTLHMAQPWTENILFFFMLQVNEAGPVVPPSANPRKKSQHASERCIWRSPCVSHGCFSTVRYSLAVDFCASSLAGSGPTGVPGEAASKVPDR